MAGGYLTFAYRFARGPLYLDGEQFTEDGQVFPLSVERAPAGVTLTTAAQTQIYQARYVDSQTPIGRSPMAANLSLVVSTEDQQRLIERCAASAEPVRCYLGLWVTDVWQVTAAADTQTTWNTSRSLPYDLISRTGTPDSQPRAQLDGADLTVLSSGTPGSGEVTVPSGTTTGATITTQAVSALGGSRLTLFYPAAQWLRISVAQRIERANALEFEVQIEELLP